MRRVWLLGPVVVAGGLLLAATGASDAGPSDTEPGEGETVVVKRYRGGIPTMDGPPHGVAASIGGDGLHVTTYGSSTCPNVPIRVSSSGPQTIDVVVERDLGEGQEIDGRVAYASTDDLGPTTSVVDVPEGIDPDQPVSVVVSGDDRETRTVVVPAR